MSLWNWLVAISAAVSPEAATSEHAVSAQPSDPMTEAPDLAIPRAVNGLSLKTQLNDQTWRQGSSSWSVDLDRGVIEFENPNGWHITAPVQVIGTYDTRDGTFMWGWDHPSVPDHSAQAAKRVLEYGSRHGIEPIKTRLVSISEQQAWEYTALADYLSGGNGAYRGRVGTTLVFMTFGEVTISKD
ncbi:MAG TPA: hypothetical protein PKN09_04675 [Novosphingobium sp.]|nr:hypothetical protein [Novosphingobium sp.]